MSGIASRHARRLLAAGLFPAHHLSRTTGFCALADQRRLYRGNAEREKVCRNRHYSYASRILIPQQCSSMDAAFWFVPIRGFAWWSRGSGYNSETGADSKIKSDHHLESVTGSLHRSQPDQSEMLTDDSSVNTLLTGEDLDANTWERAGEVPKLDIPAESLKTSQAGAELLETVTNESLATSIWSILRLPADGVVVLVDGVHNMTGAPWWLTIVGSTLAFRATIFPFTITYIKKSAQFASSISLLPPIRPPPESGKTFAEQYRVFTKRRLELGVPSPFWAIAGLAQAPLFLYWIIALRGMAMASHPGFETGGVLWFSNLTVPVQGALGALFPTLVALTYFINVQVSFRTMKPSNDVTGFFMKIYQWWLEAMTIPLFLMGFYLPQGVFMYWLTNNTFNLLQSLALQNESFRSTFGLPLLSEMEKLRSKQQSQSAESESINPELLDLDGLLSAATQCVANDRDLEAVNLLKFALEKYPDEPEAYNVYGMLHIKKRQWSEALEYYSLVISKARDDPPRITALMGSGIALYNQGRRGEAVDVMRPLMDMNVPEEPVLRVKYLRALVTLSSAMSQEGLKDEALSVLEAAAKWDSSINVYVEELKKEVLSSK
ncbi:hypothetical protein MPTK1_2g23140 [Marchantia polymorpha subsp. ruderalis]|uniref:Uncharacterized protein n=2 Tax=Marchantia polymorpha TaxID=3197 RepID=A0A176VG14_MARPO|nr:hypothetical protein AXG93_1860s1320 [Marchantia polymorpha subsp. ruderalis]PTQ35260.1 hypothetical protein MARPO_0072s0017 [Marchantia polymorpha]BBN03391.1 hypothetical protein Mp_2g23140 [Marchantia polymorpha subsp. ruderalis]|eukprot:PTQ35260.1 hypothetical protein MARPO_0072s0017 [Marchantia polymorpha]